MASCDIFPGILQMFHPENKSLFSRVTWYFTPKPEVLFKSMHNKAFKHVWMSLIRALFRMNIQT
jgi:hypothetical protein